MKTPATKSMLNQKEMFKLCNWLKENISKNYNLNQAVAYACEELGFVVSYSNMRAASEITDLKLVGQHGSTIERKGADRIYYVASELVKLMEKLNEPVPNRLLEIAKKIKQGSLA